MVLEYLHAGCQYLVFLGQVLGHVARRAFSRFCVLQISLQGLDLFLKLCNLTLLTLYCLFLSFHVRVVVRLELLELLRFNP